MRKHSAVGWACVHTTKLVEVEVFANRSVLVSVHDVLVAYREQIRTFFLATNQTRYGHKAAAPKAVGSLADAQGRCSPGPCSSGHSLYCALPSGICPGQVRQIRPSRSRIKPHADCDT